MKRPPKIPKVPGFMRSILSQNLSALLDYHYKSKPNITQKQKALASDSTIKFSTIQRLMKQQTGANLETLELIATAFDLSAYQLLIPNLSPNNPQLVRGATKDEQRLYATWRKEQTFVKQDDGSDEVTN